MKAFADLLDRLVLTPSRNGKLKLLADYFRDTPDPDRGYGLAAIAGTLDLKSVKPALVNQLLTKIDGVDALNNILLIGMTNRWAGCRAGQDPPWSAVRHLLLFGPGPATSASLPTRAAASMATWGHAGAGQGRPAQSQPVPNEVLWRRCW